MYNTAQRFGGYDAVSILLLAYLKGCDVVRQTFIYVKPMRSPSPLPTSHLFLDQTEGPNFFFWRPGPLI